MGTCDECRRTDIKCCHTCARKGSNCKVWNNCGSDCPGYENFKKINFDRIKAMSVEEMAKFLYGIDHYFDDGQCIVVLDGNPMNDYQDDIIEWLQQEVEE